jgi:hypothetical protein
MEALPHILNRYFTIYLLIIFNSIARGDPILGAQYFGAFTSSIIIALVYLNARIIAKTHHFFYGLLAVLFLLTFAYFTGDFGVAMADYTVTMMILAGVLVFILYWRVKSRREILLFLFGLILVLSFKSKETGIIMGLLIPGFFIDAEERLTKRGVFVKLGLILLGCLLGILIFMLHNSIFLKDILFGLRLSDIIELIEFNSNQRVNQQDVKNNYLNYIASNSMFLLSLVSIIKSDDYFKLSNRWLWFSILGIIPFLDLTIANGGWQIVPRYLTPVVAILSILAPQIIQLENSLPTQRRNIYLAFTIVGSLLISGVVTGVLYIFIAQRAGWGFEYFAVGVLSPIVLCFLIFWLCFKKRNNILSIAIIVICIGILTLPIAAHRVYKVLSNQPQPYSRFLPFTEFKSVATCNTGNILISGTIYQNHKVLSRNKSSSRWMYDLFFYCHMTHNQFDYSEIHEDIFSHLLNKKYQYVFLDDTDYHYLVSQKSQSQEIFDRYRVEVDESQRYYLLIINP